MPQTQNLTNDSTAVDSGPADNLTTPCKDHAGKILELYCHDHKTLLCTVCVALKHTKPCNVEYIPDISKKMLKSDALHDIIRSTEEIMNRCDSIKEQVHGNANKSTGSLRKALADVQKCRSDINRRLNELEAELTKTIDDAIQQNGKGVDSIETICDDIKKDVQLKNESLTHLNETKQANNLFVHMHETAKVLDSHEENILAIEEEDRPEEYQFVPNKTLQDLLQQNNSLGVLSTINTVPIQSSQILSKHQTAKEKPPKQDNVLVKSGESEVQTSLDIVSTTDSNTMQSPSQRITLPGAKLASQYPHQHGGLNKTKKDNKDSLSTGRVEASSCQRQSLRSPQYRDIKPSKQAEILVRTSEDVRDCWITGITEVSEGHLALIDCINNSIKLCDSVNKKVLSRLLFGKTETDKPWDVTLISDNVVAVTFPYGQLIQFVSVSNKLNIMKQKLKTAGECQGICFHQDKLIVTYRYPGKLEILDLKEKVIKSITTDTTDTFSIFPRYVQANNEYIYVSFWQTNEIIMYDWSNNVIGRCKDIKEPGGIVVLKDNSCIVCSNRDDAVYHVAEDGRSSEIITTDVSEPLAVCMNDQQDKLYISIATSQPEMSRTLASGSDSHYDLICICCHQNNISKPAHGYCIDCGEHLCARCYKGHTRPKPCRHHRLLDSNSMPQTQNLNDDKTAVDSVPADNLTTPCKDHSDQILQLYCNDHNMLLCTVCVALKHTKPCNVEYIPDISKKMLISDALHDIIGRTEGVMNRCDSIKKQVHGNANKSTRSLRKALADVRKCRSDINRRLNKLEAELTKMIDTAIQQNGKGVDSIETTCDDIKKDVQLKNEALTHLNETKQANNLFVHIHDTAKLLDFHEENVLAIEEQVHLEEYKFVPNKTLQDVLQQNNSLGVLSANNTGTIQSSQYLTKHQAAQKKSPKQDELLVKSGLSQEPTSLDIVSTTDSNTIQSPSQSVSSPGNKLASQNSPQKSGLFSKTKQFIRVSLTTMKASSSQSQPVCSPQHADIKPYKQEEVLVKTSEDASGCWITGMTEVSPEHIVLTDHNNNSIKVCDSNNKQIISILLFGKTYTDKPWDVTSISNKVVAVTFPFDRLIQFVSVSNKLNIMNQKIKTAGECQGICYHKHKLIVTYCNPGKLEILDMKGNVIKLITTGTTDTSSIHSIFCMPWYVQANKEYIYVSDIGTSEIIMFDWSYSIIGRCKDIKDPRGIVVLKDNSCIVCDSRDDAVYHVAEDGKSSEVIIKLVTVPLAACVNAQQDKLYISRGSGSSRSSNYKCGDYLNVLYI
ncbi:hypothetical protein ACF0H5_024465 [Mactra antiquata]